MVRQRNQGVSRELLGVVLQGKGVLRAGQQLYHATELVGCITSGTFSPTLNKSIGFARVILPLHDSVTAGEYTVKIRDKMHVVCLVKPPFVKKGVANF